MMTPIPQLMMPTDLDAPRPPIPPAEQAARAALDELIGTLVDAESGSAALDAAVSSAFGLEGIRPFTTDIRAADTAAPSGTRIVMVIRDPNQEPGHKYLAIAGHPGLEKPIEWWHPDPCCAQVTAGLMTARALSLIPDGLFGQ